MLPAYVYPNRQGSIYASKYGVSKALLPESDNEKCLISRGVNPNFAAISSWKLTYCTEFGDVWCFRVIY
jgi:hypothetical protein